MSRIGLKPITVESGVAVEVTRTSVTAKGPLGEIRVDLPHGILVTQKGDIITVNRTSDVKLYKSLHGTLRSLIQNAISGVGKGFEKRLELVGIGFRAAVEGSELVLQVGYTHSVKIAIPEDLTVKVEKNLIIVSGRDKARLGQFCADVRAVRKPDRYKGKGIRYQGEIIRMKQGKALKAAG